MKKTVISAAIIVASALAFATPTVQADDDSRVHLTPIGSPTWQPVDIHTFSAPIGTFGDGFAEFSLTEQALLPPPHYSFDPVVGIVPGTPEPPPYDHDLADGLTALGIAIQTRFGASAFNVPNGVWITWMTVPTANAPTGSSPDYASGPIIPNSLFPITVTGVSDHNGKVFDSALAGYTVPAVNALPTPFAVDGYSHFPNFVADSLVFGPGNVNEIGVYDYQITMTDAAGNGWKLTARFHVVPDQANTGK